MSIEWDEYGYPTDESLAALKKDDDGRIGWARFAKLVASLPDIMEGCPCASVSGQWLQDEFERWEYEVEFHTGGWSGAESVISQLLSIHELKLLYHTKWERGGHYWFRVPERQLVGTPYARASGEVSKGGA